MGSFSSRDIIAIFPLYSQVAVLILFLISLYCAVLSIGRASLISFILIPFFFLLVTKCGK